MCGIAGHILRHGRADRDVVERQLSLLRHRGPDASGAYVRGRAAVGQTRLSIIDLQTGDPPIISDDDRLGVVLNGEIYNYEALRGNLLERGHRFHTTGDTEVVLHLAEDPSMSWVTAIEGMFAAAIWDERRERLHLLRDRLGKKPLYWWKNEEVLVFGSEVKAVLAHPAVVSELDPRAIPSFLHTGYVPSPGTFYSGIESVPPGHFLSVGPDLEVRAHRYWERPRHHAGDHPFEGLDLASAGRRTLEVLRTAVSDRLVGDVPVGAFLSGGLDSAIVVGLMSEMSPTPFPTFTMGFDDGDGFDERADAAQVARHFGTDHHEFVVRPDATSLVEDLVWHHDQPFGDSSAIPMWLLAQHTSSDVKVALSGDGGDEAFAGYDRMTAGLIAGAFDGPLSFAARPLHHIASWAGGFPSRGPKIARFLTSLSDGLPDSYRELSAYAAAELVTRLAGHPGRAIADYDRIWGESAGSATLDRLLDLNLRTYLLDDLLPKVDRTSMAHALEVRSPLLDHRVIELAAAMPPRLLHRCGQGKVVLREAAKGIVPTAVLTRKKHGFGVPLSRWFREDLSAQLRLALGAGARVRAHLDGTVVDQIVREHQSGHADHRDVLWSLLTLETFLDQRGW